MMEQTELRCRSRGYKGLSEAEIEEVAQRTQAPSSSIRSKLHKMR